MKLRQWANREGVSYRTALRMAQAGTLPVRAHQLENKTWVVEAWSVEQTREAVKRLHKDDQLKLAHEIINNGGI